MCTFHSWKILVNMSFGLQLNRLCQLISLHDAMSYNDYLRIHVRNLITVTRSSIIVVNNNQGCMILYICINIFDDWLPKFQTCEALDLVSLCNSFLHLLEFDFLVETELITELFNEFVELVTDLHVTELVTKCLRKLGVTHALQMRCCTSIAQTCQ